MFEANQPDGDYPDPAFPDLLLYVARDGAKEAKFDWGAGRWFGKWRRGDLTLVPANVATDITLAERHHFIALCLPVKAVAIALETSVDAVDFGHLHAAPFRDELLAGLCERLWSEAIDGNPRGTLFADGAFDCIVAMLARHAELNSQNSSTLSPGNLQDVLDHIDANIAGTIRVEQLATLCGMSRFQFSRAFSARMGMSPYAFILQERVQRAAVKLVTTKDSLAEIALDCGFSNQQHMTTAFRDRHGTTPGSFRAQRRSDR